MSATVLTALVSSLAALVTAATGLVEAMRAHGKVKATDNKVTQLQDQVNGSLPPASKSG